MTYLIFVAAETVNSNVYTNLPILIDSNVDLYMYLIETLGSVHVKIDV